MHRHTLWCWLRRNVRLLSVFVSVPAVTLSFSTFLHSSLLSIAEHCGNDCLTRLFPCKCIINRRALTLNYWIVCVCLLATTSPHSCRFWFAVGAVFALRSHLFPMCWLFQMDRSTRMRIGHPCAIKKVLGERIFAFEMATVPKEAINWLLTCLCTLWALHIQRW